MTAAPPPCPACGGRQEVFHEATGVPVTSCRLFDDPAEARALPTGDLRLGFCRCCGFISNTAFDPALTPYDAAYEESQEFSEHFVGFAEELARHWVERYDVRDRDVLEIGCGKASFLALLCELGDNRGVGVDPSARPERLAGHAAERVRLVRDLYDERWGPLEADVVVCRHTLEHVAPVRRFLDAVREGIGGSTGTVVLFELPDTTRVLREGAFWDVYYEHCSYFTASSLSALFRRCGFEVLDCWTAYDDQYLVLEARPGARPADAAPAAAELAAAAADVARFRTTVAGVQDRWRRTLLGERERGGRSVLWGGGSKAVAFLSTLGVGDAVDAVVDVNPHKQGRWLPGTGHPVLAPKELVACPPDLVVVMNPVYEAEIRAELQRLGLDPRVEAL